VLELYRLIDWLLVLPADLTIEFRRQLREYEEEKRMPYVTSIERLGREEGRREGRREGRQEGRQTALQESILELLETRFGALPPGMRELVEAAKGEAQLKRLLCQAALVSSLEEFSRTLDC
jgi:predicted transposase YdaD